MCAICEKNMVLHEKLSDNLHSFINRDNHVPGVFRQISTLHHSPLAARKFWNVNHFWQIYPLFRIEHWWLEKFRYADYVWMFQYRFANSNERGGRNISIRTMNKIETKLLMTITEDERKKETKRRWTLK